ncbi:MAG: FmdB family zinc ribbon protein [bacterium]|nr:FmdB family zinc ribbon protein [bacterium]
MPTYEYRCGKCKETFEIVQRITADPLDGCLKCGGKVERLINTTNFILKGNGWYKTDYSSPGSSTSSEAGSCSDEKNKPACQTCPANSD